MHFCCLKPYLLAGPVPNREALVDVCIGQPWLDRMEGQHLHLRNKGPLLSVRSYQSCELAY